MHRDAEGKPSKVLRLAGARLHAGALFDGEEELQFTVYLEGAPERPYTFSAVDEASHARWLAAVRTAAARGSAATQQRAAAPAGGDSVTEAAAAGAVPVD